MPKYEYDLMWEEGPGFDLDLADMNKLGGEGWDVIVVVSEDGGCTCLLRRQIGLLERLLVWLRGGNR